MIEIVDKMTGEIKTFTFDEYRAERDRLLIDWQFKSELLARAKDDEMKARKEVVNFAFNPDKNSGTENIDLGNGWKLKAVKKINYGFVKGEDGKTNRQAIDEALQKIRESTPSGLTVALNLVDWKPTLSISKYDVLSPGDRAIIDEVIVTTEGAPSLEIVAPKSK